MSESDLDLLYREHAGAIRSVLRGLFVATNDIDDCLQATWLIAARSIDQVPAKARRAWLIQVAKNKAIEMYRKGSRGRGLLAEVAQVAPKFSWEDPARIMEDEELKLVLRDAIGKLPELQRLVVEYRIDHGLSFQAIATKMRIPLGTALTRMRAAVNRLSEHLRDRGY
jgi:RNA polymerase sigma-70 factor (ECF subfamily)